MKRGPELAKQREVFRVKLQKPLLFRAYLLKSLPAAFFMGLRLDSLADNHCTVSVPYTYFTKNPFRSIYFAAQSAAAELSTGILARMSIQGLQPMSMLITEMNAIYVKKAMNRTYFTCRDGEKIRNAAYHAYESGEPVLVKAETEGIQETGETVSRMQFVWSFKRKV